MNNFEALGLNDEILKAISDLGFIKPTPIQEKTIPEIMNSTKDIIGLAQTGTGKTAAFGLPLIDKIDTSNKKTQLLVLCPTRELCIQITKDLDNFSKNIKKLQITPVYGGANIVSQISDIKRGSQIIVGTPGRALDLIKRKALDVSDIKWLVLDEADEMLNMGFKEELDGILASTPADKRNFLFSATMPSEIRRIAEKYMHQPIEISAGEKNSSAENVKHEYYVVKAKDKYLALKRIVDIYPNIYGIVFCRTRMETKEVAEKLMLDGYNSDALHGDLTQAQRDHVMGRFRSHSIQMLVATDVAARGLDVTNLTHIINYNLPDESEAYIHRSGRTGRAGKNGISVSILHSRELSRVKQLEKLTKKTFEKKLIPNGKDICEKQLFNLIDKIENIEINESQIEQYLSTIYKKIDWLSREELIKRFVSVEFNRFLDYYKNAEDLNTEEKSFRGRDKERDGDRDRDRGNRDRKSRDFDDKPFKNKEKRVFDTDERHDRHKKSSHHDTELTDNKKLRKPRIAKFNYSRIFINLGTKSKLNAGKLLELINTNTSNKSIEIGKIDILKKFSFFEVEQKFEKEVLKAFKDKNFNGEDIVVELAEISKKKDGK